MFRRPTLVSILACSALLGCGSSPTPSDGRLALLEPRPEALVTPGWVELSDLSLHAAGTSRSPREPFIRGRINGAWFRPEGDIQGPIESPAAVAPGYVPGWVWLPARAFYEEGSPVAPRPPYVRGHLDRKTGAFLPLGEVVHDVPAGDR